MLARPSLDAQVLKKWMILIVCQFGKVIFKQTAWGAEPQFHSSPKQLQLSYSPCKYQGLHTPQGTLLTLNMVIVWVHKLTLPGNAASAFITLFRVISPATHSIAFSLGPCIRIATRCSEDNHAINEPWMQTNKHNWNWCARVAISSSPHTLSQVRKVRWWNTAINSIHSLHLFCWMKMLVRVPKGIIILSGPFGSSAATHPGKCA